MMTMPYSISIHIWQIIAKFFNRPAVIWRKVHIFMAGQQHLSLSATDYFNV